MMRLSVVSAFCVPALIAGCMVGPDYKKPDAPVSAAFKELLPGWKVSTPIDTMDKGEWWSIFDDLLLDRLEREVNVSNQTLRQFEAAYREAQDVVLEARGQVFPALTLNGGGSRSQGGTGGFSTTGGSGAAFGSSSTGKLRSNFNLAANASWDLDVWGRIRRTIESDVAGAQASQADLANARLSAQASLASDYFQLRGADAMQALLDDAAAQYTRSLQITLNQYNAGTAARSDVITAQTQLQTTQAQAVGVGVARAQFEHAIAVLTGHPPADLTIDRGTLASDVPVVPPNVPSRLLERRPDIAAAERLMQQENALIGVAIAAYYPDISLSGLFGYTGTPLRSLISAADQVWSLGVSTTQSVFQGGTLVAQTAAARAAYDQSVAVYRQTVLTALQQVEDQLSGLRILEQQAAAQAIAVASARHAVDIALNEYRAGTQAYTAVVVAQATALANEESAVSIQQNRLLASVSLVEALGGGWNTGQLANAEEMQRGLPFLTKPP
jgi:NodT family efflux transporter outer membrane factor (OMF) lipoprotein